MIYPILKYRMRTEFLRPLFSDFEIVDGMNSPHHERLEAIKDENERIKGTKFWIKFVVKRQIFIKNMKDYVKFISLTSFENYRYS